MFDDIEPFVPRNRPAHAEHTHALTVRDNDAPAQHVDQCPRCEWLRAQEG